MANLFLFYYLTGITYIFLIVLNESKEWGTLKDWRYYSNWKYLKLVVFMLLIPLAWGWVLIERIKNESINREYNINPSSLDVRLGPNLQIERGTKLVPYEIDEEYHLLPGHFALAETVEIFHLPDNVSCEFRLKSSLARMGLGHALAVWIDPGFNNSVLTLELKNYRQQASIRLYPGMKIGQIIFHRHFHCETSYRVKGRYNGDRQVTASKGV